MASLLIDSPTWRPPAPWGGPSLPRGRHAAPHAGHAPPGDPGRLPGLLPRLHVPLGCGHLHGARE
eukprot:11434674-Alexandrium_andersonii.AAC.1